MSQRHAIVTLLLKKTGLDSTDMSNFRPVSNLSFMSKVVKRAVVSQLTEYLSANDLLACLQSAHRKSHSTETAMLRVRSDVLMAADVQEVTLLAMLDLSAAFNCSTTPSYCNACRLEQVPQTLSSNGSPSSCLNARNRSVTYNGKLSTVQLALFGDPQGSVLGPLLYVLYTAELFCHNAASTAAAHVRG